jgi:hypothetical protein
VVRTSFGAGDPWPVAFREIHERSFPQDDVITCRVIGHCRPGAPWASNNGSIPRPRRIGQLGFCPHHRA